MFDQIIFCEHGHKNIQKHKKYELFQTLSVINVMKFFMCLLYDNCVNFIWLHTSTPSVDQFVKNDGKKKKTKISKINAEKKWLQMQPGLNFCLMQFKKYIFWSHCAQVCIGLHAQCDSTEFNFMQCINTGIFSSIPMCFPLNDSVAGLCSSFWHQSLALSHWERKPLLM